MSRLQERVPALANPAVKLQIATDVLDDDGVTNSDGRISLANLTDAVAGRVASMPVNEQLLVKEGRRAAAQQVVTAFVNARTIKLNREQRLPEYQMRLGFEEHYLKVGPELVPVDRVTVQDMETLLERQQQRVVNAELDESIWRTFFDGVRPALEAGETLVTLYSTDRLPMFAADALEAGSSNGDSGDEGGEAA